MNLSLSRPAFLLPSRPPVLRGVGAWVVVLLATVPAFAQGITVLHDFFVPSSGFNEGNVGALVDAEDGTLCGVSPGAGLVPTKFFRARIDGPGFAYTHTPPDSAPTRGFVQDGGQVLIRGRDGRLFVLLGGASDTFGASSLCRINADGSGFAVIHTFPRSNDPRGRDGVLPRALLQGADGDLYGITRIGSGSSSSGDDDNGTVWRCAPDGSNYRVIFSFNGGAAALNGSNPISLIQGSDGNLYGNTQAGGARSTQPGNAAFGGGTVFTLKTDGTGFAVLVSAPATGTAAEAGRTRTPIVDGGDGFLYGTGYFGGTAGQGSLFRMRRDGSGYELIYSFRTASGANPEGAFFLGRDGNLYGAAATGGTNNSGVFYKVSRDGTAYTVISNSPGFWRTLLQGRDDAIYAGISVRGNGTPVSQLVRIGEIVPVTITQPPRSQTVALGGSVTFTVAATGATGFQWRRNGVAIPGATGSSYTLDNLAAANAGTYSVLATNLTSSATSAEAVLTLAPLSTVARLTNLSILTSLSGAADSFTLGYVVGGAGTSGTKPLVIRAVGPSLTPLGVGGALADPKLEIFAGATKTGENDNWGGGTALLNAMDAVGAFRFTGPASLDAAIATSVALGDNSVKVTPVGNLSGAVIAEIYDGHPAASFSTATPRLVNVSVLKNIGTSLTAGFVIGGAGSRTLLIRAVGPTLGAAPFNVPGIVADPQLVLFNAAGARIGENDNWGGTPALTAAFTATGAFQLPTASRDAALVTTLQPGNYTVQVSGVGGTSGTALVEVYEVP